MPYRLITQLTEQYTANPYEATHIRWSSPARLTIRKIVGTSKSFAPQYAKHSFCTLVFLLIALGVQCRNGADEVGFGSHLMRGAITSQA